MIEEFSTISFGGSKGDPGEQGPRGPKGDPGEPANLPDGDGVLIKVGDGLQAIDGTETADAYFGTNGAGVLGFYALPEGGGGGGTTFPAGTHALAYRDGAGDPAVLDLGGAGIGGGAVLGYYDDNAGALGTVEVPDGNIIAGFNGSLVAIAPTDIDTTNGNVIGLHGGATGGLDVDIAHTNWPSDGPSVTDGVISRHQRYTLDSTDVGTTSWSWPTNTGAIIDVSCTFVESSGETSEITGTYRIVDLAGLLSVDLMGDQTVVGSPSSGVSMTLDTDSGDVRLTATASNTNATNVEATLMGKVRAKP